MTMLDLWPDEKPAHASACMYCHQDDLGQWTPVDVHERNHLALTCPLCADTSPNRLLFSMNHPLNRGWSWEHGFVACSSLSLRLNHISYDIRHGELPAERDATVFALGFLFGPDGSPVPPLGWPVDTNDFEDVLP